MCFRITFNLRRLIASANSSGLRPIAFAINFLPPSYFASSASFFDCRFRATRLSLFLAFTNDSLKYPIPAVPAIDVVLDSPPP
jgi:hypothetical protein